MNKIAMICLWVMHFQSRIVQTNRKKVLGRQVNLPSLDAYKRRTQDATCTAKVVNGELLNVQLGEVRRQRPRKGIRAAKGWKGTIAVTGLCRQVG